MSREKPRALLLLKALMTEFMSVTLISGHVHTQQFLHFYKELHRTDVDNVPGCKSSSHRKINCANIYTMIK